MKTTLGAPSGGLGASNGAQAGTESRMSTVTTPLNGARLVRHLLAAVPGPGAVSAAARAGLVALRPFDPEANERADRATDLDRLVAREVAEVLDLELPARVLVDHERVDHAHRARLVEAFEVGDDLAMEVRVIEA